LENIAEQQSFWPGMIKLSPMINMFWKI
jgi:hypothetical protein